MAKAHDNIHTIRDTLSRLMDAKGLSWLALSRQAELSDTAVRDLMERVNDPRIGTLLRLAEALKVEPTDIFGGGLVSLSGTINANREIMDSTETNLNGSTVLKPRGSTGEVLAYRVDSPALFPFYGEGDIVFAERFDDIPVSAFIGDECVVQLAGTGALLLKRLARGTTAKHFTLQSFSARDLENVQLAWAAPVRSVTRKLSTDADKLGQIPKG